MKVVNKEVGLDIKILESTNKVVDGRENDVLWGYSSLKVTKCHL